MCRDDNGGHYLRQADCDRHQFDDRDRFRNHHGRLSQSDAAKPERADSTLAPKAAPTSRSGGEVRGCLSIFNTTSGDVVIPPRIGNVTGLQQITGRNIVYVIQNNVLGIYDTTTNKLQVTPSNGNNNDGQIDIVGQPFDVKLVD